jgi:uncharacterized protein (DUF2336 family)
MGAALSLIPELEDVIARGSRRKRAETLQRITALFLNGASQFGDAHVDLFDTVLGRLIEEIESKARAELANRLAPIDNAPRKLMLTLAHDDDIAVAGPVLKLAPRLQEVDLVDLAQTKSQAHLQAISTRQMLGEAVTDVLVRRGDRDVARSVAANRSACISETGFFRLVKRAESDGILAEQVGLRPDIPPQMFRELLERATAVVHRRLLASASPELKAEIRQVLARISQEVGARGGKRDYGAAQRVVLGMHRMGQMDEPALATFANGGKYEETVVGLAALSKVPIDVADRLMAGDLADPVLILCKAAEMDWPTVKSIIMAQAQGKIPSSQSLDAALANYGRLSPSTAQRVVRFWQVKQNGAA